MRWLGLKPSQVVQLDAEHNIGLCGERFSRRDTALMSTIRERLEGLERLQEFEEELEILEQIGKHELQYIYGHPDGIEFMASRFIPQQVLRSNALYL